MLSGEREEQAAEGLGGGKIRVKSKRLLHETFSCVLLMLLSFLDVQYLAWWG